MRLGQEPTVDLDCCTALCGIPKPLLNTRTASSSISTTTDLTIPHPMNSGVKIVDCSAVAKATSHINTSDGLSLAKLALAEGEHRDLSGTDQEVEHAPFATTHKQMSTEDLNLSRKIQPIAASRVFGTTELLQIIYELLSLQDRLINVHRVCKHWRSAFLSWKWMQQVHYFTPIPQDEQLYNPDSEIPFTVNPFLLARLCKPWGETPDPECYYNLGPRKWGRTSSLEWGRTHSLTAEEIDINVDYYADP